MTMKIRTNFWPKQPVEAGATIFLIFAVPTVYWFEIFVVLPEFHAPGTFMYYFHTIVGTYVLFNIVSNTVYVMLSDTSIKGEILKPPDEPLEHGWRLCATCEIVAPPRSWHCDTCKTCILKRDHHCLFTSCCVGHRNHRYFIMLLAFLFLGTLYCSIYNNIFIWYIKGTEYNSIKSLISILFPLFMMFIDTSIKQYYLFLYQLSMVGVLLSGTLLVFHLKLILKGKLTHEKTTAYNQSKMENLKVVLGDRWYLTWLSPFLISKLPNDGIDWDQILKNSEKNQ